MFGIVSIHVSTYWRKKQKNYKHNQTKCGVQRDVDIPRDYNS